MTITDLIKRVQAELGLVADGLAGPVTWRAIHGRIVNGEVGSEEIDGDVDNRSESVIATLHPRVRQYAVALIQKAAAQKIQIKIISGLRTYEEQDALFAKGGVTKARGGYSNHNFGIAFDIGIFDGKGYKPESPQYKAVGSLGMSLGLEWGGSWTSFVDEPHFQLRPQWAKNMSERDMLAELRKRKANGIDAFT